MVSLPDYDPNNPKQANDPIRINRLTTGVFEMGSTFKALTVAMALDSGKINAQLDRSMRAARCATASSTSTTITARTACSRCRRSSPIRRTSAPRAWRWRSASSTTSGSCKKLGQLDRLRTELPESAEPLVPKRWGELNTVTIAFGHGLSVAPLQAVTGINALVNGGLLIPPTFLKRTRGRGDASSPSRWSSPRPARRCAT